MTIAIIGAGTLGTTLAAEFSRRGLESRVISRSELHAPLPPGVEYVTADARHAPGLAHAIAGATVVLQTSQPAYTRWIREFPPLQAAVLEATEKAGARLVLADNLYAYGGGDHGVITDATPETPCSRKGRLRKAMAEDALAAHRAGRVQVALTRPSNYVGAAYPFTRRLLTDRAAAGKPMQVFGRVDQPHSFGYVPDVARAMADVALADDAYGRAWILPATGPITQRELCDTLWTAAGQPGAAKIQALRGFAMTAVGMLNPLVRASREMLYEYEAPFIIHARDFEERFGWTATPIAEALAETAATSFSGVNTSGSAAKARP